MNAGVLSWKDSDLTMAKWIGRAALGTTVDNIRATVESNGAEVVSVEAIETKHGRFASFKLVVKKSQLDIVENGDIWPDGVLIGKWWSPKSPSEDATSGNSTVASS